MIVHRDLSYATSSDRQQLDLYVPEGAGPHPLILWVHGGGWLTGSHALAPDAPQLRAVARSFALASVGYRLSREAVFPAQLHDVHAALQWLRASAERYGLDRDRMGAWGASAGGHLVALLATSTDEPPRAVVDWYGPTDFLAMDVQTAELGCPEFGSGGHDDASSPESRLMGFPIQQQRERVRDADPARHAHVNVPPMLIQHGARDCTVPWLQSRHLADSLRAAGARIVVLETLDGGHGGRAFDAPDNVDRVLDFFAAHMPATTDR